MRDAFRAELDRLHRRARRGEWAVGLVALLGFVIAYVLTRWWP